MAPHLHAAPGGAVVSTLQDRKYRSLSDDRLLQMASYSEWHIDKAHVLYELAHRAIDDHSLLPQVLQLIGKEVSFTGSHGTPLGQPAAAVLVDCTSDAVRGHVARGVSEWDATSQCDFFLSMFDKTERASAFQEYVAKYNFVPKILIDDRGNPQPL
jgi:hypothetical protein